MYIEPGQWLKKPGEYVSNGIRQIWDRLVCTVTPADKPPLAIYIGFLQVFTENPF